MEKAYKKYLSILTALALVISFAGCTNDDDDDDNNDSGESPAQVSFIDSPYLNNKMNLSCFVPFEISKTGKVWVQFSEDDSFDKSYYAGEFEAGEHETVVLGMKADTEYQIRIMTSAGEKSNYSEEDYCLTGSLPPLEDFPQIEVLTDQSPEEKDGYLFFTVFRAAPLDGYVLISDMQGNIVFYHHVDFAVVFDLEFDAERNMYYIVESISGDHYIGRVSLDGTYLDEGERYEAHDIRKHNSYHHEIEFGPDGFLYALGLDVRLMTLEETGKEMNIVADSVMKINTDGSLLEEWSSWDYLGASGPSTAYPGPVAGSLDSIFWSQYGIFSSYDWTHANAVLFDWDNETMLVSYRHLSELIKIDMKDNSVIWEMGKNYRQDTLYDFELTEGEWFYRQHAPEFLPNGNLMMYDNGYSKAIANDGILSWPVDRPYSRAVEYEIDEQSHKIKQVWEYREGSESAPENDFYSDAMGEVDLLDSGNILLTSSQEGDIFNQEVGNAARILIITHELGSESEKLWEMKIPGWSSYRSEWFPTISPEPAE